MSGVAPPPRARRWAQLLAQAAPSALSALLPLLATPVATMGTAAVSAAHDAAAPDTPASRSFVFGSSLRACAICLEEYHPGDRLCMLEPCAHCFHQVCIDSWFRFPDALTARARACPVCNVALGAPRPFAPDRRDARHDHRPPPWPTIQLIDVTPHQTWAEWFTDLLKLYCPHNSHPPSSPPDSPPS